ncbi:DMT family transporter [Plasticicumulans lactativorans]|nr:DMT family transporter [Plasticicumulans lactativorans]
MTVLLYALTVLIWGTTWIAIKFQLGVVPIEASIVYRFALAAAVLFVGLLATGRLQRLRAVDHGWCLAQGACLFCLNFVCFYAATGYVTSGTVSVVFSAATVFNAVNGRLFFGRRLTARVLAGAALGVSGLTALFWRDLAGGGAAALHGVALAAAGTLCFSFGNMISARHQALGLRPLSTNAWGMLYGTLLLAAVAALRGVPFTFDASPHYVAALLYLAIPGSVIGFTAYLTLVGRIGADRAAYATVLFPVVALTISSRVEGYQWSATGAAGLALVMLGNVLVFRAPRAS